MMNEMITNESDDALLRKGYDLLVALYAVLPDAGHGGV